MERRRIVERAGIDVDGVVLARLPTKYEAATDRAEIAHGIAPTRRFRYVLPHLAAEADGAGGECHERHEPRARGLAAIGAITVTRVTRLAFGFVAHRAAETAARVDFAAFAHALMI